jgi:gamma-glutamyl hydrolase
VSNNEKSPLSGIANQSHVTRPVKFLQNSSIFKDIDSPTFTKVTSEPGIYHFNHQFAINSQTFKASTALSKYFNLSGVSVNSEGVEFVSVVEGRDWPVYGVQFHPEKNNF